MEEYMEEGPSLPSDAKPVYGGYRKKLVDKILPNMPDVINDLVEVSEKKTPTYEMEKLSLFKRPVCGHTTRQFDIEKKRPDLINIDKVTYCHENGIACRQLRISLRDLVQSATVENIGELMKDQPAYKMKDLEIKTTSTKSTVVYFPEDIKLTNKHLVEITPKTKEGTFWPHHWKFDDKFGCFICFVDRIDKNNYEFKVMMMPGTFTDDPVTLTQLMHLFNPLHYGFGENLTKREVAMKKATMMVAAAANEFFGPQIVESCIAVWLSCRPRNPLMKIKHSSMITKIKNITIDAPPELARRRAMLYNAASEPYEYMLTLPTENATPANTPVHSPEPMTVAARRKIKISTTTKYANFLTAVFGYNRAMYPDVRTMSAPHSIQPMYDFIREIHVNEEQLYQLLAELSPSFNEKETRMKG